MNKPYLDRLYSKQAQARINTSRAWRTGRRRRENYWYHQTLRWIAALMNHAN